MDRIFSILILGGFLIKGTICMKTISISIEKEDYYMGEEINLSVKYKNETKSTIKFKDPIKTWEVSLRTVNSDDNVEDVHFGKIFYTKIREDFVRATIEEADTVELDPGGEYQFTDNIAKRWPEVFIPGYFTLQVMDETNDDMTIYSNQLKIKILFSEDSPPALLNIAADTERTSFYRRWAMEWLQKIYPDFILKLPAEDEDEPPSENDENFNMQQVDHFKKWWAEKRNTKQVRVKIENINKGYF